MKRQIAKKETIEIQKAAGGRGGKLGKYMDLILGRRSLAGLIRFEFVTGLLGNMPGAVGILLRGKAYRKLLGKTGRNVTFGRGVVIRHPHKIFIGDNVIIDDGVLLDAKGQDNHGIRIGNGVFIGRDSIINCKNGDIILEDRVNISSNVHVFSASAVRIGEAQLIASYAYLVGGTHLFDDPLVPVLDQGRESRGISIGPGGWVGAHATVFDGVKIGKHAVLAANSAVSRNIPSYAVAGGSPVEIINRRRPVIEKKPYPAVTVGIVNYNGEKFLESVINSIKTQDYPGHFSIVMADNSSDDQSVNLVRRLFPEVKILSLPNKGPNPARNVLLRENADYTLLMDNDIELASDVISALVEALEKNKSAGIAGAQILWADKPEIIQYNGAYIHYAGAAVNNNVNFGMPEKVSVVPAGAQLVNRKMAMAIGLYDEDYFYGWADGDFAYRMTLSGFDCLNVPDAKVYHKKEKKGSPWTYYQVRNRWWFILKTYYWRSIILLFPMILVNQFAIFVFCLFKGELKAFLKGTFSVFKDFPVLMKKRKQVMSLKKVKDKKLLCAGKIDMLGDMNRSLIFKTGSMLLNGIFRFYWMGAKWFIK